MNIYNPGWFLFLSVVIFLLSLVLPMIVFKPGLYPVQIGAALNCPESADSESCFLGHLEAQPVPAGSSSFPGFAVLLGGWFGDAFWFWFADILFLVSFLLALFKKHSIILRLSLIFAVLGFATGFYQSLTFKAYSDLYSGTFGFYLLDHFGLGYYLWMLAFVSLAIYSYRKLNYQTAAKHK